MPPNSVNKCERCDEPDAVPTPNGQRLCAECLATEPWFVAGVMREQREAACRQSGQEPPPPHDTGLFNDYGVRTPPWINPARLARSPQQAPLLGLAQFDCPEAVAVLVWHKLAPQGIKRLADLTPAWYAAWRKRWSDFQRDVCAGRWRRIEQTYDPASEDRPDIDVPMPAGALVVFDALEAAFSFDEIRRSVAENGTVSLDLVRFHDEICMRVCLRLTGREYRAQQYQKSVNGAREKEPRIGPLPENEEAYRRAKEIQDEVQQRRRGNGQQPMTPASLATHILDQLQAEGTKLPAQRTVERWLKKK